MTLLKLQVRRLRLPERDSLKGQQSSREDKTNIAMSKILLHCRSGKFWINEKKNGNQRHRDRKFCSTFKKTYKGILFD